MRITNLSVALQDDSEAMTMRVVAELGWFNDAGAQQTEVVKGPIRDYGKLRPEQLLNDASLAIAKLKQRTVNLR